MSTIVNILDSRTFPKKINLTFIGIKSSKNSPKKLHENILKNSKHSIFEQKIGTTKFLNFLNEKLRLPNS